ncbi:hypothetical protein SAMN03159406_01936 [Rhizobium sp. NFR03]|nr:hypothetical protein SAMN03159406_01936 [Rhizobium sp. NFR03]
MLRPSTGERFPCLQSADIRGWEPFGNERVGKRLVKFLNRETHGHEIAILVNRIRVRTSGCKAAVGPGSTDQAGCEGMTTMRTADIETHSAQIQPGKVELGKAQPAKTQPATGTPDGGAFEFTMEMLELELSLDGMAPDGDGFSDRVRAAAADLKGAFLFDLPASGLVENCQRIAVLRIPRDNGVGSETIFACLEADGTSIRIEKPNERTTGLARFAQAFVDVFQRM